MLPPACLAAMRPVLRILHSRSTWALSHLHSEHMPAELATDRVPSLDPGKRKHSSLELLVEQSCGAQLPPALWDQQRTRYVDDSSAASLHVAVQPTISQQVSHVFPLDSIC